MLTIPPYPYVVTESSTVSIHCLWPRRECRRGHCLWPRRQCAGARALDAPVPPRQLYSDYPTPAPPAPERQVSTYAGRCSRRVGQEGKQRHVPTCTRSTNGCGSLGGANRVWGACRWLRLRSGAQQWQRMVRRGPWRPGPEGAAKLSRRQGPLADWNRLSIEYP